MNFKDQLKRLFGKKQPVNPEPHMAGMPSSNAGMAKNILEMVERTQPEELTCDEVFALLDQFAEMAVHGEDVAGLMPMVQQHLDICPDCREEYQALMNILGSTG